MKKKGYLQDILFFGIIIFILVIVVIVGSKLNENLNTQVNDNLKSSIAKDMMNKASDRYDTIFNWIFFSSFVLLMLAMLTGVFLLDTHPVFYFAAIIILAIIVVITAILGNAYDKFSENDELTSNVSNLTIVDYIMDHWVKIIVAFGFLFVVLLFAKSPYR